MRDRYTQGTRVIWKDINISKHTGGRPKGMQMYQDTTASFQPTLIDVEKFLAQSRRDFKNTYLMSDQI